MRYQEIRIRTLKETPALRATPGGILLMRGGYLKTNGEPTPLGDRAMEQLRRRAGSADNLWAEIGLEARPDVGGLTVFVCAEGDVEMLRCTNCGYAAPAAIARSRPTAQQAEGLLPIQKVATPDCNTIDSLASFLGIPKNKTAKGLMYERPSDSRFVFVVIRGDTRISERKLENQVGVLKLATPEQIATAGAVAGYASPVGLKRAFVVVDEQIPQSANLVAGANEAGYHLQNTNIGRDFQADLVADLTLASAGDPCPDCGMPLEAARGYVLADSTGYLYKNIVRALAEKYHDDRGLCWPVRAAPFDVHLVHLPAKDVDTAGAADDLYQRLEAAGLSVLYDDREERAGVKFYDADLLGLPLRLTVGAKSLANGMVELKPRTANQGQLVPVANALDAIRAASSIL